MQCLRQMFLAWNQVTFMSLVGSYFHDKKYQVPLYFRCLIPGK